MTTTANRLGYPLNYRRDHDADHTPDYLSNVRTDPNLHYFHEQLESQDATTAHRLSHAANLLGSDPDKTADRVAHVINAVQSTRDDEALDEKSGKNLSDQVAAAITAYHDRQRQQLEFMSEHADYELPKTPRQKQLDLFEQSLKKNGLEYVKADSGDITVTFPNKRVRDEILQTVPEGFARRVKNTQLDQHKQNLIQQRQLENTYIFKADDQADALNDQLLAEEMDRRAKHRSKEIASLLDKATSDQPESHDNYDSSFTSKEDITHRIAELLHDQFEDDNKTITERLSELPIPDLSTNYTLESLNQFTDESFRERLIGMKIDYDFKLAREALIHDTGRLNTADVSAHAATEVTHMLATVYYNTLTKFADLDDGLKFAAYQTQATETGEAVRDRITEGKSLIKDSHFEMPHYTPPSSLDDPDHLAGVISFHSELSQALKDTDDIPPYVTLAATQLLEKLDAHNTEFSQYLVTNQTPNPVVVKEMNRQTQDSVHQLHWLLKT